MKGLIIVESPAKIKTIKKIVGGAYDVAATVGHIIDLPENRIGINTETFEANYTVMKGKAQVIKQLQEKCEGKSVIVIATDPDREGEAIAWHVQSQIKGRAKEIKRARFTEITSSGINDALDHLSDIDMNMVNSQQARRILDRLVGYEISPILWKILYKGLSAGRVQSAALRLIVEREQEIRAFIIEKYWEIFIVFDATKAKLVKIAGKKAEITSETQKDVILTDLNNAPKNFVITGYTQKESVRKSPAPFITSTLQQDAYNRFGYSAKKTMMIAQGLYEGVDIPEGSTGLITYMRTDSFRVSQEALTAVRDVITHSYGAPYLPKSPKMYSSKNKNVQGAHEAIRPTSVIRFPDQLRSYLTPDQFKIYKLIWERFVASQMTDARYTQHILDIENGKYLFEAGFQTLVFDGFERVYPYNKKEDKQEDFSRYNKGQHVTVSEIIPEEKETTPPPYYTEATLVKQLEALGIGRPSTYASIISVLVDRKYADREKTKLKATDLGIIVNNHLVELFPKIVDYQFTSGMENDLDRVEQGEIDYKELLRTFYTQFTEWLGAAKGRAKELKQDLRRETDIKCEKCGLPMVVKWSKNGEFLACSGYPECKNAMNFEYKDGEIVPVSREDESTGEQCPECKEGMLVYKKGRYGKFLACNRYPECKYTKPVNEAIMPCPKCATGSIIARKSKRGRLFYGCSKYPECDFVSWDRPAGKCPTCGAHLIEKNKKVFCSNKECGYVQPEQGND